MGTKYMTRLSKWARWMLPKQEAEDVIADYQDIVGSPPRSEEELLRDLGKPRDVIKPLVQPKQYRVWLVLFLFLSACILTLGVSPTGIAPTIWRLYFGGWVGISFGGLAVAVLGAVISLAGEVGLIKARTKDRRWTAVYIMALAAC